MDSQICKLTVFISVALVGLASYQTHTFLQGKTPLSILFIFALFLLFDCIVIVCLYILVRICCRL